jgi:metal-responsive CopG/Arc/MetJ family transcriptional regulator
MAKKPDPKPDETDLLPVSAYLERSVVEEIDGLAKDSRRSRSQMFAVLIDDALAARRDRVAVGSK